MASILVVVAHPDDLEIMCGGTVAKHVADGDTVYCLMLADGVTSRDDHKHGDVEARRAMCDAASRVLGYDGDIVGWPDQRLDTIGELRITKRIELEIVKRKPTVVYTHWWGDLNTDHRIVSQCVRVACRPGKTSVSKLLVGRVLGTSELSPDYRTFMTHPCEGTILTGMCGDKKREALHCYLDELSHEYINQLMEQEEFFIPAPGYSI